MTPISRLLEPTVVEKLNHLAVGARRVVEGSSVGLHRSPLKGASVEFRQHRSYVPGDEPKRIDWRVLARTDRAFVKEYDEETNLRCLLVLDASGSMSYGKPATKFTYAARLAAGLTYLLLARTEAAGLAISGHERDAYVAPASAGTQLARVIDLLERAAPEQTGVAPAKTIADTLGTVAERLERRSLVIIISDLLLPIAALRLGLARLKHGRHELLVVRTLHPDETAFPFQNWFRFAGLEAEKPQLLEASLVKARYLANFEKHRLELIQAVRATGADLVTCQTNVPLIDSIVSIIRRK